MIGEVKQPSTSPKQTGDIGRANGGRFGAGNKFGRGNPNHSHIHKLRQVAAKAATEADVRALMKKLHAMGMAGDVAAAKEYFERAMGKSTQPVDITSAGEEVVFTLQIGHLNGESPSDN